jgi:hypothetical protein
MKDGTEASHVRSLGPCYEDLSIATSTLQYLTRFYRTHKSPGDERVVVLMDYHTHDVS